MSLQHYLITTLCYHNIMLFHHYNIRLLQHYAIITLHYCNIRLFQYYVITIMCYYNITLLQYYVITILQYFVITLLHYVTNKAHLLDWRAHQREYHHQSEATCTAALTRQTEECLCNQRLVYWPKLGASFPMKTSKKKNVWVSKHHIEAENGVLYVCGVGGIMAQVEVDPWRRQKIWFLAVWPPH